MALDTVSEKAPSRKKANRIPAVQISAPRAVDSWTHTRADTLDKADPRTVRTHAALAALLFGEVPGVLTLVGGAVAVSGIVLVAVSQG